MNKALVILHESFVIIGNMYLLYLDDSGSTRNLNEDYLVLGGVAVPEQSTRWLSYQIEQLAESLQPDDSRNLEFHASETFSGKQEWAKSMNRNQRIGVIKGVLETLAEAYSDVVVFACAIHKHSYPDQDPVELAFEQLSSRFALYLRRRSSETNSPQKGLIFLDKSSYENSLQSLAVKFRSEGNRWGNEMREICEVPLFLDSKSSRILQLADHIAYAVFRRYNASDLNYYNCIESRFDSSDGVIHGLVHLQRYKDRCTCPACLSRRPY